MKTFKFGQLVDKEDICDRKKEVALISRLCSQKGRLVIYGPRRYGKTSLIKNVILKEFSESKKHLGIFADLFQVNSKEDFASRLKMALEQALSRKAKIKTWLATLRNYFKNFYLNLSFDPLTSAPSLSLQGSNQSKVLTLQELFSAIKDLSRQFSILLVLAEFQDIIEVDGLEALLRSEIQALTNTSVILMGSKKHILREIFQDESRPFYSFGTDIELKAIDRKEWVSYMKERFEPMGFHIEATGVEEICKLMHDVPNSIQELCQWIFLNNEKGKLSVEKIHSSLASLLENKSSRYLEKTGSFTQKEKQVLIALAQKEFISSPTSIDFVHQTGVSPTAIRAIFERLLDQGVLQLFDEGYQITDPLFSLYLKRGNPNPVF